MRKVRARTRSRYRKTLMIYRSIVIGSGATEPHDSYYVYCRTAAAAHRSAVRIHNTVYIEYYNIAIELIIYTIYEYTLQIVTGGCK